MKTIKLLKENAGRKLTKVITNFFLAQSPKAKYINAKINKQDLIKLKSFCTAMETINKTNKQKNPTEWEEVFANEATDKGLISRIHKQLTQIAQY